MQLFSFAPPKLRFGFGLLSHSGRGSLFGLVRALPLYRGYARHFFLVWQPGGFDERYVPDRLHVGRLCGGTPRDARGGDGAVVFCGIYRRCP
jgi:hypothetical protein